MLTERSIVIAEDNAVLRGVLTEIFRECGWRVRSAEDGFSALKAFAEELPAVLLSDLEMSGMSGFELLSIVHRRFPSVRVVAMSAAFTGSTIPAGVAADAFYAKGGSVATLLDVVAEVGSTRPPGRGRSEVPVWLPSSLPSPAPYETLAVACSNCLRAIYVSNLQAREQSGLICPHCQQQITVFLLHEPPDTKRRSPQLYSQLAQPASLTSPLTPESTTL